jgi:hypothetical protein
VIRDEACDLPRTPAGLDVPLGHAQKRLDVRAGRCVQGYCRSLQKGADFLAAFRKEAGPIQLSDRRKCREPGHKVAVVGHKPQFTRTASPAEAISSRLKPVSYGTYGL